jgi:hypothetical protein
LKEKVRSQKRWLSLIEINGIQKRLAQSDGGLMIVCTTM